MGSAVEYGGKEEDTEFFVTARQKRLSVMNAQPNGTTRGGLRLAVDNTEAGRTRCPTAEKLLAGNLRVPSTATTYPVRLARTTESTEMADLLVDAYHRERLTAPMRSMQRVEVGDAVNRDTFVLAIEELEARGWTVSAADFAVEIASATALWLRPFA